MRRTFLVAGMLVAVGVAGRLIPHIPNATPITALAFVAGMSLRRYWAVLVPVLAVFLSDLLIGLYDWKIMLSVYGSYVLIGTVTWMASTWGTDRHMALALGMSSVLFFLITNTAVWAFSPWYEKNMAGLMYAYELGIPFFRNMLIGDVLYVAVFIGFAEFITHRSLILNIVSKFPAIILRWYIQYVRYLCYFRR